MASSGIFWDNNGNNNNNNNNNSIISSTTSQMFVSNTDHNGEVFSSNCSVECMEAANARIAETQDESSNQLGLLLKKLHSLGLVLQITPSFLESVQGEVNKYHHRVAAEAKPRLSYHLNHAPSKVDDSEKLKAANFNALLITIGSWQRVSRPGNEVVAKCYFAKRKLLWEILEQCLKYKIEILWSDIIAISASTKENEPGKLAIELKERPTFYKELNPQPRKHTIWKLEPDFTGGQASLCRWHYLKFPPGVLDKHYEKLLASDPRLSELSNKGFPSLPHSPYFDTYKCMPPNFSYISSNQTPIGPIGLQFVPGAPSQPSLQQTPSSISGEHSINYSRTFADPKNGSWVGGVSNPGAYNLAECHTVTPIQPSPTALVLNCNASSYNKETQLLDLESTALKRIEQHLIDDSEIEDCNQHSRDRILSWEESVNLINEQNHEGINGSHNAYSMPNWSNENNNLDFIGNDNVRAIGRQFSPQHPQQQQQPIPCVPPLTSPAMDQPWSHLAYNVSDEDLINCLRFEANQWT